MTAPVAPMEARCSVCLDTANKSQQIDGFLDCTACNAAEQRLTLRNYLGGLSPFMDGEQRNWAAYLFAQRQATPVLWGARVAKSGPTEAEKNATTRRMLDAVAAQPAQQVEAVGQKQQVAYNTDLVADSYSRVRSYYDPCDAPSSDIWTIVAAVPFMLADLKKFTAPQLEAQQAGDVALKAAAERMQKAHDAAKTPGKLPAYDEAFEYQTAVHALIKAAVAKEKA